MSDGALRRAADLADGRTRRVLASALRRQRHAAEPNLEGLRIGLRTAEALVEDGAPTIYRSGYWLEEGMLVVDRLSADADVVAEARRAVAELAAVGAAAALEAGSRGSEATPDEIVHEAVLAAVAASVPVALVLAEGTHNQ